jgi:phthiocerol/phenolphthiocerol synthesis type-I polyketide synthase E
MKARDTQANHPDRAGRGPVEHARRDIAVVGMAGRFPGAANVQELWRNLMAGAEAVQPLSPADLERAGVAPDLQSSPTYVRAAARLEGLELFDAAFFGLTPREAEATDPQHRLLLECAWEALENAGYAPSSWQGRIGLFAGASTNRYFEHVEASAAGAAMGGAALFGLDKDFLTTRVSYRLGLEGPSVTVQTACSTSLVAVHLACQSLLAGDCDLALAGGVALRNLRGEGYVFEPGGILSPDGHCRAFDVAAAGTVSGDGIGLVALRRLDDALADGDAIAAVIKGSAINNDGAAKVGYTAPGLHGQVRVLRDALAAAGVDPATVSYVEAHGTGTPLGDPIEMAALAEAYGPAGGDGEGRAEEEEGGGDAGAGRRGGTGTIAVGSVKTNLGHLDAAAGIAGLIKVVLALRHGAIPPSLHFTRLNPRIPQDAAARFTVAATAIQPWEGGGGRPRRAGISSFGIGGTNAHAILEEAPPGAEPKTQAEPDGLAALRAPGSGGSDGSDTVDAAHATSPTGHATWQLLQISARTESALAQAAANLAGHLESHPEIGADELADVAFTLRVGRRAFDHRRAVVCRDAAAARAALRGEPGVPDQAGRPGAAAGWTMSAHASGQAGVAFLLPGQGAQRAGMAAGLYRTRPAFRAELDRAADLLAPHLDVDLRQLLLPQPQEPEQAAQLLGRTRYTQPALFAVEYALARLWIGWGVQPAALLGHSIGEWVAACLAGVFSLEDALALVALRGRLIDELPQGAMLAVPIPAAELEPLLGAELALAAENAADRCVASGPAAAIADLERRLAAHGIAGQRLRTSHAFHSPALEPAAAPLARAVSAVARRQPAIPFVSNLTGTWILADEATDPTYWGRQMLAPVRFAAGLRTLAAGLPDNVLLEVGPGESLSRLARRELREHAQPVVSSLPEQQGADDQEHLLRAAARLWLAGAPLDPHALTAHERRRRVALPTYPFERQRYWMPRPSHDRRVPGPAAAAVAAPAGSQSHRQADMPWQEEAWQGNAPPAVARHVDTAPGAARYPGAAPGATRDPGAAPATARHPGAAPMARLDPADWFYLPSWRRSLPPPAAGGAELPAGGYLLFGERAAGPGGPLTAAVAARLRAAGRLVTVAFPGPALERLDGDTLTLRPSSADDYDAVLAALAAAGRTCGTVLHLWNATESGEPTVSPGTTLAANLDVALERGFYSLMALGQALGRAASREPLALWVVSRRLHDVAGGEPVAPERAPLLGPCRVLPLELPHVACRSLDLPPRATGLPGGDGGHASDAVDAWSQADAELLLAEVAARPHDQVVAYRGPQRWAQDFEPVRLGAAAGVAPPLRPQGVYLVTGGLGGIGQALARWLARAGAAGLVLLGRSQPPLHGRHLHRLRELEEVLAAAGAQLLLAAADVTDRAALARVRNLVHARFGALHGVIHAAGVPGGGIVQLRRRDQAAAVLAPKVQGTLALAAVFPPEELDFFILCSSLNAVLGAVGQADYCAANAFVDAFAAARSYRRPAPGGPAGRVVSIAWDRWDQAGMAAEALSPFERRSPELPPLPGEAVTHPLLDRRLPQEAGRQTFVTRLSAARHWMLDEHRFSGTPVLPGTALLELVRAAAMFAGAPAANIGSIGNIGGSGGIGDSRAADSPNPLTAGGAAGIEIRSLSFVAPLVVADGESRDVFTSLSPAGDGWQVRIASREPGAGWREHAVGEVAPLAAPLPAAGETVSALADLLAALPLEHFAAGTLPAPPPPEAPPPAHAADTASGAADHAAGAGLGLTFGPHWQGIAGAVSMDGDQLLARFELPAQFAGELDALALHPALLDLATGFVAAAAAAGGAAEPYLPFSYAGLRQARPLPATVYSHARRLADAAPAFTGAGRPGAPAAIRSYAVTLYDVAGQVLLTIDQYVFRRVESGGPLTAPANPIDRADAADRADATDTPAQADRVDAADRADRADPADRAARTGLSNAEGVDVFARVLAHLPLPQVLVSTRDLRARAAAAAADTGERLLAQLAELGQLEASAGQAPGERHPRPALGVPYAAPRDAAEERLAEIWQLLLGIDRIGVDDDFFELGGDSVLGLRVAALARERGIVLSAGELFAHPTIASLAQRPQEPAPAPPPAEAALAATGQPSMATQPATASPDDFPDAEISARDLDTLLAQLGAPRDPP